MEASVFLGVELLTLGRAKDFLACFMLACRNEAFALGFVGLLSWFH